jgi:hypothetical protein
MEVSGKMSLRKSKSERSKRSRPRPAAITRGSDARTSEQEVPDLRARPDAILDLQSAVGNRVVTDLISSRLDRTGHTLARQEEDELPDDTPPDWQHGAPTKPVAPDPHVWEQPERPREPPEQGPYRTPGERPENPPESGEMTTRERIAYGLKKAGVPAWAAAGLVVLVVAAIADPEPFTKVALLIGAAAAIIFFVAIGRRDAVPAEATASTTTGDAEPDASA